MKEYGSDFHYIKEFLRPENSEDKSSIFQFYANGRQALQGLITYKKYKRIWVPEYFCYEIIESIRRTGVNVILYPDAPGQDDKAIINNIMFEENDVLLRMNFFGMRSFRDNININVDVIEDHSHDLNGNWAYNSNADWCIASIRKSVPIPEGGVLWSPQKHNLPEPPLRSDENKELTELRWQAMHLKKEFLAGRTVNKDDFRKLFIETENAFKTLRLSAMDERCLNYYNRFDTIEWNNQKRNNWECLCSIHSERIKIVQPEDKTCVPFSFVILFKSEAEREQIRLYLINSRIYPVILWKIPDIYSGYAYEYSNRMLAIPCDARFSGEDILEMKQILNDALKLFA